MLTHTHETLPLPGQQVLDSLPEAILFVDARNHIQVANAACAHFFPGTRNWDRRPLISGVMDHRIDRLVREARDHQENSRQLITNPASQLNQQTWWEIDAQPIKVNNENWVRIIIRDESERQHLEHIRRDFVANASHELRTPLTILRGYLENLLDGGLEQPQLAEQFVKTSLKHADRLTRLVEDMLTISKLEHSHDIPLSPEPFQLNPLIKDVLDRLEPIRAQQNARFQLELSAESNHSYGDSFYWEQILFNLIENALKNNQQRDKLQITIRSGPCNSCQLTPSIELEPEPSQPTAQPAITPGSQCHFLEVTDNGVGIPKADLTYIFKRFYRVQKDHGPALRGTGLGLSIVRRAVEAHQGTIQVSSIPGEQTTFRIEYPTLQPEAGSCDNDKSPLIE